nr:hypothetical protein [Lunatimonas salinarum]
MQDSAKLGERVTYVLKAEYPADMNLLFPDSLHNFGSMEYLGKQTFRSVTRDTLTTDSALYFLANFSLEPVKMYHLPVFEILRYDSITHRPADAPLALKLVIDELPDALAFQETNAYQKLQRGFNYPILILMTVVVCILLAAGYVFFGDRLNRQWLIYLEKKRRQRFVLRWDKAQAVFFEKKDLEAADELLGVWRGYMESLTGRPFREWTSTEIAQNLEQPELVKDLREIEVVIYANRVTEGIRKACERISSLTEQEFQRKIKNLHGHE